MGECFSAGVFSGWGVGEFSDGLSEWTDWTDGVMYCHSGGWGRCGAHHEGRRKDDVVGFWIG